MTDADAYADDARPASNSKAAIVKMVAEQLAAEKAVTMAEEDLAKKKKALADIKERRFPELMAEMGQKKTELDDGTKVRVDSKLRGSITKPRLAGAIKWLDDNGASKLVKRSFEILFDKGEEAWAKKFAADLAKRKKKVKCEISSAIHTGSVLSFLAEMMERGKDVPLETFGAYQQKETVITLPKPE